MKLYLIFAELPELRKFSKAHRQLIYAECIVPILEKRAMRGVRNLLSLLLVILSMKMLPEGLHVMVTLLTFLAANLLAILFCHLWDIGVVSGHREELRKRIEPLVWSKMARLEIFSAREDS